MNPLDLITPPLIDYCSQYNSIIVCGPPKSGKITISKKLAEELNRPLLKSDDYIDPKDRLGAMYIFMDDILKLYNQNIPFIAEGVMCFRVLRKGLQLKNFSPELILKTICDDYTTEYFYNMDGENYKINRVKSFKKSLDTIWNEYLSLLNNIEKHKHPKYLELDTSIRF